MSFLNFLESVFFLEKNNIKCLDLFIIDSKKKLKEFNDFPYVLKISSDMLHKTENKAIYTNIYTKDELEKAYDYLNKTIIKNKLKADIVLQKQIDGLELIIGVYDDKQLGKVLMFGFGGIFTEIFKDNGFKKIPVSKKDIKDLVKDRKIYTILKGYRSKKYDLDSLYSLLEKISNLAVKEDIKELDLNPVIINENNVYIVDARVRL